jgi:UDP-N-acetylglucosamine acyltransferase
MIHPSACVSPNAKIAQSACIGPWCLVEDFAEIGENVVLESRVHVLPRVKIGEGTVVFDGASLGNIPQDLKFAGEETSLEIGAHARIREYVTVHRGTALSGKTVIGDDVLLMAYVHVAHDCVIENGAVISNGVQLGGHVHVGEFANIGGTAGIAQNCRVGAFSFVGASLKVDRDVPPYIKALGTPLRFAGVNLHALRKHPERFPESRIVEIERLYREFYHSAEPLSQGIQKMAKSKDSAIAAFFSKGEFSLVR